jgi:hypothetical protein
MSLEDELEPKLAEIDRLAMAWYNDFLRINGFMFDEHGTVVLRPGRTPEMPTSTGCRESTA